MKKQIIYSLIWLFAAIIWTGLDKVLTYQAEMQYSAKAATSQVDNDAAYTVLKTHSTVINLIDYGYYAGLIIIVLFLIRTWMKRKPATT